MQSPEDYQYMLMCASMELQKVKSEGRLQESMLWRLQELLSIMTKERDEAREECKRLQECLLLQNTPAMGVDSPSSFMHSSSMVSSPSSSPWSLQELEEHLNNDDFCVSVSAPAPFELQQALESLSHDGQHLQSLFSDVKPAIEKVRTDSHQQFHLQILDQPLCFDAPPCFNVSEVQNDEMIGVDSASIRSLSRQSSSNSTSASVRCFQQEQCSVESPEDMTVLSPAFTVAGTAINAPPSFSAGNNVMYVANQAMSSNGASMAINGLHPKASMANNGAYMANDAPALMSSISNNGSYVIDNASSLRSYMGNNEAPMNGLPSTPRMGNNGASQACQTPSMGNHVASLADNSMPAMPSMKNNAASTVYTASPPTSSEAKSVAIPTPSLVNNVLTTSTISTQSSDVSTDTEEMPSPPAKVLTSVAMSVPKAALSTGLSACPLMAPRCNQQGIPTPMRQVHLPEPPEADPQVMLNSLPEKGKLLQAVMQAGPLLQTLLLAGPLPQWRHPPPALSTGDIPKVSLAPNNVLLPYSTHMTPSAVQVPMGSFPINKKGSHSTTRRRPANTESCSRSRKLRKLSPFPTKQGQSMHMVSGSDGQKLVH